MVLPRVAIHLGDASLHGGINVEWLKLIPDAEQRPARHAMNLKFTCESASKCSDAGSAKISVAGSVHGRPCSSGALHLQGNLARGRDHTQA
jgi:hypothetical protein